ncbi:hypothetical protein FOMG_19320 [Fusarium oxysporum f. sp. melonis 26406]|uniref:Heterokaryon incompatibility domain-containing protein n=1 Tax=Fusarium oxysporum f. sp. melonis 26406 TaxID=1089452 RepID=W9Z6N4_FUSOX|nr:hypothetical protein FOMG_19320 [Fusarium oxysporum f. sp. melonis 26406]
MDMFKVPFDQDSRIELGKVGDCLDSACPHTNWLRHNKYFYGSVPFYEKQDLFLSKDPHTRELFLSIYYKTKNLAVSTFSPAFELVFRPDIPDHQGKVRILDDSWVNLEVIKGWITSCIQEHGSKCDVAPGNVKPFKPQLLIDVMKACVVSCKEDNSRFVTLSYTWGQTKNFRTTKENIAELKRPGVLRSDNVLSQLPKTIVDAMELTKALGETWLWVDSLCIVQDDEEGLAQELAQMHRIYATSFLTIIAADGQDADHGLRGLKGISSERSINQIILPLAGGERIARLDVDQAGRQVNELDYHQRMWTSQEHDFAKRRLYFKSGIVKWECSCTKWSENHPYDTEADTLRVRPFKTYIGSGVHSHVPSLNTLSFLVRDFNSRTVRFAEDVFDAFAGYSTYLDGIFPSGLLYGHPHLFFDISLCWYPLETVRRRVVSKEYKGDPRHNRLPSWSWMGWKGKILFPFDLEGEVFFFGDLGFTEAITEWYTIEHPGAATRQPIKSKWSQYRNAPPDTLPDIWRCKEYEPPTTWNPEPFNSCDPLSIEPRFMPKELPSYVHTHISDTSHDPVSRWYPIPTNKTFSETGVEPGLHSTWQYLWCQTLYVQLFLSLDKMQGSPPSLHLLKDIDGNTVGALNLPDKDDPSVQEKTKVELIGIAKGWSSILRRYSNKKSNDFLPREGEDQGLTECEEQDEEDNHVDWILDPWKEVWDRSREDKQDCYHVLWIEWENEVAYRRASGLVLADDWNRLVEPNKVDITLG